MAGQAGRGSRFFRNWENPPIKGFRSSITEIATDTFNTGQNKFVVQFTQLKKNVANYIQQMAADEGYLIAKTVRTGKEQMIMLPPPINQSAADIEDQKIIQEKAIRAIAKQKAKLDSTLKKGYVTVWDQCSQEVRDKLETSNNWDCIQKKQLLHNLITKIDQICVGFYDHKQEIFNLVQALKTLFLYTQGEKESVDKYARSF
jgi:hypothetical protein